MIAFYIWDMLIFHSPYYASDSPHSQKIHLQLVFHSYTIYLPPLFFQEFIDNEKRTHLWHMYAQVCPFARQIQRYFVTFITSYFLLILYTEFKILRYYFFFSYTKVILFCSESYVNFAPNIFPVFFDTNPLIVSIICIKPFFFGVKSVLLHDKKHPTQGCS